MKKFCLFMASLALLCGAVSPALAGNILFVGGAGNYSFAGPDLLTRGLTSTNVSDINTVADLSPYTGIWFEYGSIGGPPVPDVAGWVAAGGNLLAEGDSSSLANLPDGTELTSSGSFGGDTVTIVAPSDPTMTGLTDAGLSNWGSSYHDDFSSVGTFTVLATDGGSNAVIVGKDYGLGHITYTGMDIAVHNTFGQGPIGAFSDKINLAFNALEQPSSQAVPEPGSIALFLTGFAAVGGIAWRKRKVKA